MYTICILYVHLSSANSKLSLRQKDFQRNAAGHSDLCFKNRPKIQFCVKRYDRLPLVCFENKSPKHCTIKYIISRITKLQFIRLKMQKKYFRITNNFLLMICRISQAAI